MTDKELAVDEFGAAWEPFSELMAKPGVKNRLLKWMAVYETFPEFGPYLIVSPGFVSFAQMAPVGGEKITTRALSNIPAGNIEDFLVFLGVNIPGGGRKEITRFPELIAKQMEEHKITYFDPAHFHDVGSESPYSTNSDEKRDFADRFTK